MKKEINGDSREERFLKSMVNMFIKNKDISKIEISTTFAGVGLVRSEKSNPIGFGVSSNQYIEEDCVEDDEDPNDY